MDNKITLQALAKQELDHFFKEQEDQIVILVFTAEWLGSVQILNVFLRELSDEFPNVVTHYMDAEQHDKLAVKMNVDTLPSTFILEDGKILDHFTGLLPKKRIRERLQKVS